MTKEAPSVRRPVEWRTPWLVRSCSTHPSFFIAVGVVHRGRKVTRRRSGDRRTISWHRGLGMPLGLVLELDLGRLPVH
jgi:hypothetical protein